VGSFIFNTMDWTKGKDWTKDGSWDRGQQTEHGRFLRVLSLIDSNPKPSTREEQFDHIDWHTSIGTVDVKARKKMSRSGKLQDEYMWVEFRNTCGRDGWLFGKQDWVAFEMQDGFNFVKTKDLLKLANELCDTKTFVSTARDALYKAYQRKHTDDVISMIKFSDLNRIPHLFIKDADIDPVDSNCFI